MKSIEVGMICIKTIGREENQKCIIVDIIDKNFALITGPKEINGVKRRRANFKHLIPTEETVDIKKGSTDKEVTDALKKTNKLDFLKSKEIKK
ncbi:50S ribosomal protein L14e [[Eubacterium] cellulosolvens]